MNELELVREYWSIHEETVHHPDQAHDLDVGRMLIVERKLDCCFISDTENADPEEVYCNTICVDCILERLIWSNVS